MLNFKNKINIALVTASLFVAGSNFAKAEDQKIDAVIDQIQLLSQDLKTLEKAVYKSSDVVKNSSSTGLNEDILTKHLLKLNEIEDQFRDLTNKFEEINFKMDKLSGRVTKIQSDNQLRFSDIESGNVKTNPKINSAKKKKVSLSLKPSINIDKQRVKRKVGKLSKENLILVEKKINQLLK